MIRYYAGSDVDAPEPVECDLPGWPHCDAKGRTQYENTHFDAVDDAWNHIDADARAGIALAGRAVEHYRDELAKANERAGREAERFARIIAARSAR